MHTVGVPGHLRGPSTVMMTWVRTGGITETLQPPACSAHVCLGLVRPSSCLAGAWGGFALAVVMAAAASIEVWGVTLSIRDPLLVNALAVKRKASISENLSRHHTRTVQRSPYVHRSKETCVQRRVMQQLVVGSKVFGVCVPSYENPE